jgi:hypothetical protein
MSVFGHGAAEGSKKPPVGFTPDSSGFSFQAVFETCLRRHSFSNPVNGVNVTPKAETSQKVIGSTLSHLLFGNEWTFVLNVHESTVQ